MAGMLHLHGLLRNINYGPLFRLRSVKDIAFEDFEVNSAPSACIMTFADRNALGFSKWQTPKPSRSYPSARIYKTYNMFRSVTVIPILKDEGAGTLNNDRLNFMTLSRMNLMTVYIVLAWFESAKPHPKRPNAITDQQLNNAFVKERIAEIKRQKMSALHWNKLHFQRDYADVFRRAVVSYQDIAEEYDVEMHSAENHLAWLDQSLVDGKFNIEAFARSSSLRAAAAAKRESVTIHELEHLASGQKAYLELENTLGGEYHLTADEVYWEDGKLVIQESKNTHNVLPSITDIEDGLFKMILFRAIERLYLDGEAIPFTTRLKLTGTLTGQLNLPADDSQVIAFCEANDLASTRRRPTKQDLLLLLNEETRANPGLSIEIAGNK